MIRLGETRKETVSQGGGVFNPCVSVGPREASRNAHLYERTIKEYIPASWFHRRGIYKVLARIWDRLPDVSGKLFLTLTIDPKLFGSEESAFEYSRQRMRKVFYKLRHGVEYEGKTYAIDAPYCVKVEFHESGWVHFHVIFLTRRFLPKELLAELWGLGWVTVQRISNEDFHYLLKYVSKPDDLPAWVLKRKRLRVFQSTKGFLKETTPAVLIELALERGDTEAMERAEDLPKAQMPRERIQNTVDELKCRRRRASYTIGERFERWACLGVIRQNGLARTVRFRVPYRDIFDHLVLPAALDGRYKGGGEIILKGKGVMSEWIRIQNQLLKATN
jgi:hypothetical protein